MPYTSINRVTAIGNLTRDPELRQLTSGRSVCHIRIACNGRRRNAEGGYDQKPNFFDVSVFGPRGESVHRYLQRGSAVAVDGRLEWSEWESPEGQRREAVTVIANEVQFLGAPTLGPDGMDELDAGEDELHVAQAGAEAELVA